MTDDDSGRLDLSRRKVLGSLGALGGAGALGGYGTRALFGDPEETAATFAAGELDLTIDARVPQGGISQVYTNNNFANLDRYTPDTINGQTGEATTVSLMDVKPGDWVILCHELEVVGNPACLGLLTDNLVSDDNGLSDAEKEDGDTTGGEGEGDLQNNINVTVYSSFDDTVTIENNLDKAKTALSGKLQSTITLQKFYDKFKKGDAIASDTKEEELYFLLQVPRTVDDVIQGDLIEWDFVFDAVQSRSNDQDPYGGTCEPVWDETTTPTPGDCTPECPAATNPDPGGDDFDVTIENIDSSDFPTVRATTRVDTTAGGNGNIPDANFSVDEKTPNGIGSGFCGQVIENVTFGGGQQQQLADVMFVLDTSASMDFESGKFQSAKDGANTLVGGDADITNDATQGGFDPSVNVGLVGYESSATTHASLGTDQNTVEDEVDALSSGGGTELGEGITAANDEFNSSPDNRSGVPDFMIVLGNGDTTGGGGPATTAKNNGVTIFGIAYGSGAEVEDFSEISGEIPSDPDYKDYTFDASTDNITDIFDQIGQEIFGTYTIEYESANCEEDSLDRTVEVYVDDPDEGDANETGSYTAP